MRQNVETHESLVPLAFPLLQPKLAVGRNVHASGSNHHVFARTDRVEYEKTRIFTYMLTCSTGQQ